MVVAGLVGAVAGYWIVAYAACTWFWPSSNLCGLPGCFIGLPLGGWVGGVLLVRLLTAHKILRAPSQPIAEVPLPTSPKTAARRNLESLALVVFGLLAVVGYRFQLSGSWFLILLFVSAVGLIVYFVVQGVKS